MILPGKASDRERRSGAIARIVDDEHLFRPHGIRLGVWESALAKWTGEKWHVVKLSYRAALRPRPRESWKKRRARARQPRNRSFVL